MRLDAKTTEKNGLGVIDSFFEKLREVELCLPMTL
jgi:hypothetical protein